MQTDSNETFDLTSLCRGCAITENCTSSPEEILDSVYDELFLLALAEFSLATQDDERDAKIKKYQKIIATLDSYPQDSDLSERICDLLEQNDLLPEAQVGSGYVYDI